MNGSVLNQASRQWAKRPADESYLSLQSLHEAVEKRTAATVSASDIRFTDLSIAPRDEDLVLVSSRGAEATFNNWSFSQFCSRVGAPTDFMRQLPADLASKCLNYRIVHPENDGGAANMLFHKNGHLTLRAFTGTSYSRIWDMDITSRLLRLPEQWQPAPETTLPNGGKCRGLYASDHDIFVFLVDNNRRVFESLPGGGLSRGFMVANSEVGDKAFWMLTFLYSHICANHNVWGVQDINELRIRHVGDANDRAFERLGIVMRRYANASASEDETRIKRCMAKELAPTKDTLLDMLFNIKTLGLPRKTLEIGYNLAEQHTDWYGSPRSVWGIGNGLTEHAKSIPFADQRSKVEMAAGKVFEMAF